MIIADFFSAIIADIKSFFAQPLDFGGPLITGQIIIWALIIGFAAAGIISLYNRVFLGKFVSYLLKNKANSPENARSPQDASINNIFLKTALRSNSVFKKIVSTEDTAGDIMSMRYFITDSNAIRADRLYARNGASPASLLIAFVLLIILAAIAYTALPELLQMAENFAEMIKPEPNIA
ncbi:MAG: hypothetical protein IJ391_09110 [Clostridia bacterium]|nr:hypothetical protein [Clostridia bacterium]